MASLRDWLKLCRIQSVGTVGILYTCGAIIQLGTIFDIRVYLLFILGVLAGIVGMSLNDYIDRQQDFELHKEHKPLAQGLIGERDALQFILVCLVVALVFGGAICVFLGVRPGVALEGFFLSTLAGVVYNIYSKDTAIAPLLMSCWLSSVIVFSAWLVDVPSTIVWIYCILAFLLMIVINGCDGSLKDLSIDKVSLCKALGCRLKNKVLIVPTKYHVTVWSIKVLVVLLVFYLLFTSTTSIYAWILFDLLVILIVIVGLEVASPEYDRDQVCKLITLGSFTSLFIVALPLISIVSFWQLIILLVVAVGWYTVSSYCLYGTMRKGNW